MIFQPTVNHTKEKQGDELMYHVYSHNDLDGIGCGIVAKLAFGNEIEVRYNSIAGLNDRVGRFLETAQLEDQLFITDLSVSAENEAKISEFVHRGGKVRLLDHHKTALHLNKHEWASVQVRYEDDRLACATSLFYEFLVNQGFLKSSPAADEFVELVRQYDTWEWEKHQNLKAKMLNDLLYLLSIEEFEEKMVERLKTAESFGFDEFEEKLLEMEQEKIKRYVRKKKRELIQTTINDLCVGIVHAESYHSELGNELGKEYEHLDYIVIVNMGAKKVGFRTIHDSVDVSEIAGSFGGGGHVKASGCPLTEEAFRMYVTDIFHLPAIKEDASKNTCNLKQSEHGSLYQNHEKELIFIHPINEKWGIIHQENKLEKKFSSFEEAERFIKRRYTCWLTDDEKFVNYVPVSK